MVVAFGAMKLCEARMELAAVQVCAESLLHPGGQLAAVVLDPRQEIVEMLLDDLVQQVPANSAALDRRRHGRLAVSWPPRPPGRGGHEHHPFRLPSLQGLAEAMSPFSSRSKASPLARA